MTELMQTTREPDIAPAELDPTSTRAGARRVLTSAMLVGAVIMAGNLLGFLRDLLIAVWFGASAKTDAFLVAWTIPETTATLLMEGAMVFVMIPLLTDELRARGDVRELVRRSLGPLLAVLAGCAALIALLAPLFVRAVAPGLDDPNLAVAAVRLAAPTILFMGAAGYALAVLRVHERFVVPAFVYVAYNVGIISVMALTHRTWGVRGAAFGLTIGAILMVVLQLPALARVTSVRGLSLRIDRRVAAELAAFVPIGLFFFFRQSQVWLERFLASFLPAGSISHLNYSMKTAQVPVTFVFGIAIVSYPAMTRLAGRKDQSELRASIERTVRLTITLIAPATAWFVAFSPHIIHVLYEHGEFTSADTSATSHVMRVYALGLTGQVLVSVAMLPFFAAHKKLWVPLRAVVVGLAVDAAVSLALIKPWGAPAIALGNAVGITAVAVLLLLDINRFIVGLNLRALAVSAARVIALAAGACVVALVVVMPSALSSHQIAQAAAGTIVIVGAYVAAGRVLHVPELEPVLDLLHRRRERSE